MDWAYAISNSKVYKLNLCLDKKQLHAKEKSRRSQRQSGSVFFIIIHYYYYFLSLTCTFEFCAKTIAAGLATKKLIKSHASIILGTSCTSLVYLIHFRAGLQGKMYSTYNTEDELKIMAVEVMTHLLDTFNLNEKSVIFKL